MILGSKYKRVTVNTAAIVQDKVVPTTEHDYISAQSYNSARRIYAGMFAGIVSMLAKKNQFFVVPRTELKHELQPNGWDIESFDGLSISSINRPFTRLMPAKHEKCAIERWANPFALITDGTRNLNTFFYQMPIVKLSHNLLRMFHKSKLPIEKFGHELFGIPGVTVFLDKDNQETNNLIKQITGLPIVLDGDGIIVSKQWQDQITVLTTLSEELKLPKPFKLQGLARSKGITIADFEANRVLVEINGQFLPVDVIMNTQGKRLNKAANIVLSGMRLRKFFGEEIPVIDTTNREQLIALKNRYGFMTGILWVDGREVGTIVVGINKFYIDLTHNMEVKIAVPNVAYVQSQQIMKALDYPLFDRFPQKEIKPKLEFIDEQLTRLEQLQTYVLKLSNMKEVIEYDYTEMSEI